jgi:hypothetical protein
MMVLGNWQNSLIEQRAAYRRLGTENRSRQTEVQLGIKAADCNKKPLGFLD